MFARFNKGPSLDKIPVVYHFCTYKSPLKVTVYYTCSLDSGTASCYCPGATLVFTNGEKGD
jgi:hypothetical protein